MKEWNKTSCRHTSLGVSCKYCDEIIIKLSCYNALNLAQILSSIAKGEYETPNYTQRFCQSILNEMGKNSFRQNPNLREYELPGSNT